jgi:hypothetical protein
MTEELTRYTVGSFMGVPFYICKYAIPGKPILLPFDAGDVSLPFRPKPDRPSIVAFCLEDIIMDAARLGYTISIYSGQHSNSVDK